MIYGVIEYRHFIYDNENTVILGPGTKTKPFIAKVYRKPIEAYQSLYKTRRNIIPNL